MSSDRTIHIDRLEIRLKGTSPGAARGAVDGLGNELMRHLSDGRLEGARGAARIDAIDIPALKAGRGVSAAELRAAIVRRIGDEIERKIR
jgi:hypothetical protein